MSARRAKLTVLSLSLLAALASFAACSSNDDEPKYPPGIGPGGPLVDGGEAGRDGSPATGDAETLPATPCVTDTSPGTRKVICEGLEVVVTIPDTCPGAGCGLIIDIHGALMNAELHNQHTEMRARGSAKGYVVLQPTAPKRTFQSLTGPQWFNADDEPLIRIVRASARDLGVDLKRIHATGFSQGGYATLRLMCKYADVFASVAPGAAGVDGCPLDENVVAACPFTETARPSRAIDVLFMYGRKDALIPESCAKQNVTLITKGFALEAPTTLAEDSSYARKRYTSSGAVLETIEHDYEAGGTLAFNGGHCFPGSEANGGTTWDDLACTGDSAFVWGTEVLAFFEAHAD